MTTADAELCAVAAAAADIICSLRAADLAGWTTPWGKPTPPPAPDGGLEEEGGADARELAWPAVARGKRSRSRRGSPSASGSASASAAAPKKRPARGSPASPLDYSGASGSGASTSGGEDGAFCMPVAVASLRVHQHVEPTNKVGLARRRSILPVPPPRPDGQRPRKKMRLPEVQQVVRSLSVENDALREKMKALQRACRALSKENGKLETRLDHSSKRGGIVSEENNKGKAADQQDARNGFELPDLNLPAQDG